MSIHQILNETDKIPLEDKRCVTTIVEQWTNHPPLSGKKILINCHLTTATLLLIELFVSSGADFKVTCTEELINHTPVKNLLIQLGLYLPHQELENSKYKFDYFDVILDCGAYLSNSLHPKIGFVELTHVENTCYKNTMRPVLSVDNSAIKQIETSLGTGDGFLRAIKETYLEKEQNFQDKNYMIFGFGKVGQGIFNCLYRAGVSKKQLFVIDVDEKHLSMARSADITAFCLKKNEREILTLLTSAKIDCVVTATGVKNAISQYFTVRDFNEVEVLCNMGTDDEWGDHFSEERILYKKKPLNFMLTYPTKIKYLDPIFALLACSAVDLIQMKPLDTFSIVTPSFDTQERILTLWLSKNEYYVEVLKEMNQSIEVLLD